MLHRIASGGSLETLRHLRRKIVNVLYILPALLGVYGFFMFMLWAS